MWAAIALSSALTRPSAAQDQPQNPASPPTLNANIVNQPTAALTLLQAINAQNVPAETYGAYFNLVAQSHGNQLGVEVAPVEPVLRSQLGFPDDSGVFVTSVTADSPAAKAGLQQYDVVVQVAEDKVANPQKFDELIGNIQGKDVALQIIRQAKPLKLNVTIPTFAVYELAAQPRTALLFVGQQRYRIGVSLAPADDTLRSQLRLAAGEGLVVTEVIPDSPAVKAGILLHDVLTKLDGKQLTTVEAATSQIQEIKNRQVSVALKRVGQEISINLDPTLYAQCKHGERNF
jgi:S1-C subfamily serine protease